MKIFCFMMLLAGNVAFAQTPEPSPVDSLNDPRSVLDRPEYDEDHPAHLRAKSVLAWGFKYARHSFPVDSAVGDLYKLFGEYVLPFDKIGIISLGFNAGILSVYAPGTTIPYPSLTNPIVGGQVTYQLKFLAYQWIVPAASFYVDYYRVRLSRSGDFYGSGTATGFSGDLMINLGAIDRSTALESYRSIGLTRAYFVLGLEQMSLSGASFSLDGSFWTAGFRMEYE